jgi:hypothetical protein
MKAQYGCLKCETPFTIEVTESEFAETGAWLDPWLVYLLPWLGFYGMHHIIRAAERTSPKRRREE